MSAGKDVVLVVVPRRTDFFLDGRLRKIEQDIVRSNRIVMRINAVEGNELAIAAMRSRFVQELRFADETQADPEIVRWAKQCYVPIVTLKESEGAKDASRNESTRAEGMAERPREVAGNAGASTGKEVAAA